MQVLRRKNSSQELLANLQKSHPANEACVRLIPRPTCERAPTRSLTRATRFVRSPGQLQLAFTAGALRGPCALRAAGLQSHAPTPRLHDSTTPSPTLTRTRATSLVRYFARQYVVSGFGAFVCTRCSGVHRSFGHRVKGVSMSTFTEAELSEIVGNAAFSAVFLAGLPRGYVKPNAMGLDEVRRWIDDVYVKKKYYKEGSGVVGGEGEGAGRPRHLDISEEEIAVVPLSAILGASTPILRVESKGAEEARRVAAELAEAAAAAKAKAEVDLLGGWDPFGGGGGDVDDVDDVDDAREADVEVAGADLPSFEDEWGTFVGDVKQEEPAPEQAASVADADATATAVAAETTRETPLAAFYPEFEQMKKLQRAVAPPPPGGASSGAPPQPRAAVPLEAFFPEFEEIRRSGVLPTGLPDPTRPRSAVPAAAVARAPDVAVAPAAPVALAPAVAIPPAPATQRSRSSAVERAGKTLGFGNPFDGGYDLNAEYCPRASTNGNPFA